MSKSIRGATFLAFPCDLAAPVLRIEDQDILENWECKILILRLMGKKWPEIANPNTFLAICDDTDEWLACLPEAWYVYYLPALMILAEEGLDPRFENLRGSLLLELAENEFISQSSLARLQYLRARLNESQQSVIQLFLDKYDK